MLTELVQASMSMDLRKMKCQRTELGGALEVMKSFQELLNQEE
jgi:hypothetical protein